MKSEKLIRNCIMKTLSMRLFTWTLEIAEHSIWGFKNAPYKNFVRARNKVNSVIEKMVDEEIIKIDTNEHNFYTITIGKNFNK